MTRSRKPVVIRRKKANSDWGFYSSRSFNSPFSLNSLGVQAKLEIGAPNDKYEREADTVADRVVSMNSSPEALQRKCSACEAEDGVQRMPEIMHKGEEEEESMMAKLQRMPEITRMEEEEESMMAKLQRLPLADEEEMMQTKPEIQRIEDEEESPAPKRMPSAANENLQAPEHMGQSLSSSKGQGSPLPNQVRTKMESGIGYDLSNVRVHTGTNAVQMNRDIKAQAFTHGQDIYFNQGKYNPSSTDGQRLLAHELTHTVQQSGKKVQKLEEKRV